MMAATFGAMAFIPDVEKLLLPFLIIYGVSYFFTEFGPNSTTFVYPAEIFPVRARTTGHGIAAATGKLGGFFGVFLFPVLMAWKGLTAAEAAAAAVSVLGAIVTLTMLPETKGISLEELSPEAVATAQLAPRSRPKAASWRPPGRRWSGSCRAPDSALPASMARVGRHRRKRPLAQAQKIVPRNGSSRVSY